MFIKMENKNKPKDKILQEIIECQKEIEPRFNNRILTLKKNDKKIERNIHPLISVKIEDNKINISTRKNRRLEKRLIGTFKAHIKNMIKGLKEEFTYKLQIVNVHFPMTVSYNKEKNELIVKNFLGEKKDRIIKLNEDIDIKINKDIIEVKSPNIEKAGDAATKIELGTKISSRDRRVYQDGIFLVEKPGRSYL